MRIKNDILKKNIWLCLCKMLLFCMEFWYFLLRWYFLIFNFGIYIVLNITLLL